MARRPRIHLPGAVYHVILRGNDRQDIFFGDGDRHRFLELIAEGVKRFGYRVHAFCLMTNHLHIVVQVDQVPLSRIVQNFAFRYARRINRMQQRVGHLFQGRHKAILVETDSYLLDLVRYVHRNPVEAGLVSDPRDYRWSSHKAYLGLESIPWLTTGEVLARFSQIPAEARRGFHEFVRELPDDPSQNAEVEHGGKDPRVLGAGLFLDAVLQAAGQDSTAPPTLDSIVVRVCADFGLSEDDLRSRRRQSLVTEARNRIAWEALTTRAATLAEVSRRVGRDASTLSNALKRLEGSGPYVGNKRTKA